MLVDGYVQCIKRCRGHIWAMQHAALWLNLVSQSQSSSDRKGYACFKVANVSTSSNLLSIIAMMVIHIVPNLCCSLSMVKTFLVDQSKCRVKLTLVFMNIKVSLCHVGIQRVDFAKSLNAQVCDCLQCCRFCASSPQVTMNKKILHDFNACFNVCDYCVISLPKSNNSVI